MSGLDSLTCSDTLQASRRNVNCADAVFHQMNSLYLLSFLITADHDIAEKCFSRALDEYVAGRDEFLSWAKKDGRRAVLRQAVQIVKPLLNRWRNWRAAGSADSRLPTTCQPFAVITSLTPFERYVFVMTNIEGLSVQECASLLHCKSQDVVVGRKFAERVIAIESIYRGLAARVNPQITPKRPEPERYNAC